MMLSPSDFEPDFTTLSPPQTRVTWLARTGHSARYAIPCHYAKARVAPCLRAPAVRVDA